MKEALSRKEISEIQEEIIGLLQSTQRANIDKVIEYLQDHDFFTCPSSQSRHHNWEGGLAEHSLDVYKKAQKMELAQCLDKKSLIIASLLHDICKTGSFTIKNGKIIRIKTTHGHGKASVRLLDDIGFILTHDEYIAIRYHMRSKHDPEEISKKYKYCPLWQAVHAADKADAKNKVPHSK